MIIKLMIHSKEALALVVKALACTQTHLTP